MSEEDSDTINAALVIARQLRVALIRLGPTDPRYHRGIGDFTGDMHATVMRELFGL
jgi:hypothetical protein